MKGAERALRRHAVAQPSLSRRHAVVAPPSRPSEREEPLP
ncbi:hypothetical protein SSAG_05187 [Streptomyces sp. Mg1]|nr:hypothetical protein SSAG_05187 [Streptomyces sp. Mg1]